MANTEAGVILHIDENTMHVECEDLRDELLKMNGVMAAACHDEKPHLMVLAHDPNLVESITFVEAARAHGRHAELIA